MMYIITFNSVWNVHHMRPILMCIVKLYVWTISTAWNADCTHNMQPLIIYIIHNHNWTDSPMLRAWSIPFPLTFRLHLNLCSTVISLGNIPWAISHTIWADWACVAWHIHSIMWLCARFPCRSACVCVCLCVFANVSFVFCVYVARDFYEWTDVTCVVKWRRNSQETNMHVVYITEWCGTQQQQKWHLYSFYLCCSHDYNIRIFISNIQQYTCAM